MRQFAWAALSLLLPSLRHAVEKAKNKNSLCGNKNLGGLTMNLQDFIITKTTKYTSVTIEYKGYIFKASINYSEHHIWDKDGNIAVYNWKGELPISQEKLEQLLQWTIDGVYFCNRCLEKIEGNPIQFFAGIYCKKCWTPVDEEERKWAYSHLD